MQTQQRKPPPPQGCHTCTCSLILHPLMPSWHFLALATTRQTAVISAWHHTGPKDSRVTTGTGREKVPGVSRGLDSNAGRSIHQVFQPESSHTVTSGIPSNI